MKRAFFIPLIITLISFSGFSRDYELISPDGFMEVEVSVDNGMHYKVYHRGDQVLRSSPIELTLKEHGALIKNGAVVNTSTRTVDEYITPVVAEKRDIIHIP